MNNRKTGAAWEQSVAKFLTQRGMVILERNFRCRQGEIDLIGRHQGFLVFVEVKYRRGQEKGYAAEAVDYRKQCRICRVSDYYRFLHRLGSLEGIRYDVVAVQGEEMQWIQNAFPYRPGLRSL